MSNPTPNQAKRSRWMDWQPKARITADSVGSEPTKPSKPGSVGFEGAISGETPIIREGAEPSELAPCGSPHCGGCYEVAPGARLHPPKISPEWQSRFEKWQPKGKRVQ